MYEEIVLSLKNLINEFLNSQGFILVDLSLHFQSGKLTLRILTDHPRGGISLDECAYLNEKIGKLLDENDLIKQSYILEVSSPGADRPLKTEEDFRRCIDRKVIVYTKEPI
ncbi:MAG: ribosome maturation factor RimP, partial [Candidatus Omnitrophica bacterium]|nr:ribosome maturation factor RimP [Candidatus Omnitrophota bacterium]